MNKIINRTAKVYINNIFGGILKETDDGYEFIYDNDYYNNYSIPVSLTLPLNNQIYQSTMLFPFFDGLIPEGFLLDSVVHNWKLDYHDCFGILLVSCMDPIGNVRIEQM